MMRIFSLPVGLCLLFISPLLLAADPPFTKGVHYQTVAQPLPTQAAPGQVEVTEMFWYGCPHCYRFEPLLEEWLEHKPDHVAFRHVPAVFRDSWLLHGQAFYAAQVLGVLDKIHRPLFDAMHKEKRQFQTKEELANFFATLGIDKEEFLSAFESFAVQAKIQQAVVITRNSGITGVPAMIVNGKYRTDANLAGSFEDMLKVVDYLVTRENTAAAAPKTGAE